MSESQSPELFAHQALSVAEGNHQKILNKAECGQVSREHIPPCVTTAHRENQDEQFTLAKRPASPQDKQNIPSTQPRTQPTSAQPTGGSLGHRPFPPAPTPPAPSWVASHPADQTQVL